MLDILAWITHFEKHQNYTLKQINKPVTFQTKKQHFKNIKTTTNISRLYELFL